jgi:hypothetical protein
MLRVPEIRARARIRLRLHDTAAGRAYNGGAAGRRAQ